MKLTHRTVDLRTHRPFRIATGTTNVFPVVVATLEHDGVLGYGAAAASRRVTGEDVGTVAAFLDWAATELHATRPAQWGTYLDSIHNDICGNPSARCALDLAMHDLIGNMRGVPARALYGLPEARLETCMTVSLDEPAIMADEAQGYRQQGFRVLKLKLGDAARDAERVAAVKRTVPDARLRADANTGWSVDEARAVLPALADARVEFVEQPVAADAMRDLAALSRESPIPIYADESVLDVTDVRRLADAGFRGGVNLKLMKTGGIRPTVAAASEARALGFSVQLGCNVESAISIHGALQLLSMLDHADLDGHLLLAGDVFDGATPLEGWYTTPSGPGLGARLRQLAA